MKTIYKFPLSIGNISLREANTKIVIPKGKGKIRILSAALDFSGKLCVWILCDDKGDDFYLEFRVRGTGHSCKDVLHWPYVGLVNDRGYIWHIFAEPSNGVIYLDNEMKL